MAEGQEDCLWRRVHRNGILASDRSCARRRASGPCLQRRFFIGFALGEKDGKPEDNITEDS